MATGNLCRNKKFTLDVGAEKSRLFMCGRGQSIPETIKEYNFGYRRRKQLAKALVVDIVSKDWMSHKDLIDFILGEGLIHKVEMLALVSTFDKNIYLKNKEVKQ